MIEPILLCEAAPRPSVAELLRRTGRLHITSQLRYCLVVKKLLKPPFIELLFYEFACTTGSILTKINALVHPCIKRFCELVRLKR